MNLNRRANQREVDASSKIIREGIERKGNLLMEEYHKTGKLSYENRSWLKRNLKMKSIPRIKKGK